MSLKLVSNEKQEAGVWLTVKLLGTVWMATKLNKAHSVCVWGGGVHVCVNVKEGSESIDLGLGT